ncbi:MAG: nitroreductase family protein [Candidatus Hodarchaeales archaeon]
MTLSDTIEKRRAYRSFKKVVISADIIKNACKLAGLAPSCNNKQPWFFIFVNDHNKTKDLVQTLSKGNKLWNNSASLFIAVISKPDLDCEIGPNKERRYYSFDTGMATAFLILYLTEQGLVTHPMAGFDPVKAKKVLQIPDDMELITIISVGKKKEAIPDYLNDAQRKAELERPERKKLEEFVFFNLWGQVSG